MSTIIKIKRSSATTAPANLGQGELALTYGVGTQGNNGDRLFIGTGTETAGNAANIDVIGGKYFTDMIDHVAGTLTASSAIVVDSNSKIDQLNVDNLTLNGNTISSTDTNGTVTISPDGSGSVVINNTVSGTAVKDEDDMLSDSASHLATQQSIKAYVDSQVTAQDLDFIADAGGALNIDLDSETLTIAGGTGLTTTGALNGVTIDLDNTSVTGGSYGSATQIPTFTVDAQGRLTAASTVSVATDLSISGETGSDTVSLLTDTLDFAAGEGVNTVITNNTVTISGEDASSVNKGVASFNSNDFTVTAGDVVIATSGVDNSQLAGSIANAKLSNSTIVVGSDTVNLGDTITDVNGLTSLDVDNITVDGNEISSTDTNGNISLNPNGTGTVDFNTARITSVGDPTGDQDAATKSYVDAVKTGLDIKDSCRYTTTADLSATYANGTSGVGATLTGNSNGALSVDSATPSVSDRILVKDQSTAAENGIYVVTTVGSAGSAFVLTRSVDADGSPSSEMTGGVFTFVEEGSSNADNGYVFTHNGTPTIGTTALTVAQFSGAGQISAGAALSKTGNTLDVEVDNSSIEVSADALQVKSLGITNSMLAGSIDLTSKVTGTLPMSNGGTGVTTLTANGILFGNGSTDIQATAAAPASTGYFLYSNAGTPVWANLVDGGTF